MSRFLRLSLLATAIFLMIACGLSTANTPQSNTILANNSVLVLVVQAQPSTFTSAGQVINFAYTLKNTGTAALAGPPAITDDKAAAQCQNLNTIGNKDDKLDANESVGCAAGYGITQADVIAGKLTSNATAQVGGITSNTVTTIVSIAENKVLTISVTANPTIYSQAGQTIKYTYTLKNTGATTLGPNQFVVIDDHIAAPVNCGANNAILASNESLQCDATYTVTAADAAAAGVTNTARASGAGAGTIQSASITINNTNIIAGGTPSPSNIPRGSTVPHLVKDGEWLWQITRCYGADLNTVIKANSQLDDPNLIFKDETITIPNAGSVSAIFGPPCIKPYTVKSGDTWDNIANDPTNNAAVDVLIAANPGISLSAGKVIVIPLNSKFYGKSGLVTPPPTNQPIRLNFSASSPKVTLQGNITTPQTIRHVFTGATGQILTIKLTVASNDVGLAVYGPNNQTLKALDNTTSWSGTLTANGDHFIDLVSQLGAITKAYTLEVTLTSPTPASPIERVADINAGPGDSNVSHMSVFNGQLYFQATGNDGAGAELWRYDSGLKAVTRVADINQGAGGSEPAFLTPYGNLLYFRANGNDSGGVELWRYNGSATGRVTDINGAGDSNPMYLTVFNNVLYFSAKGSDNAGNELWKYDGTTASRAADINPGTGDSNPAYLAVFNNLLYFSATSTDGAGTELWKFDGTTATRVADINVGIGNSNPAFLTPFNNLLYFSANGNDTTGTELWKFDGTTATRAADINPGAADSAPTYLAVFNNALYFSANADAAGFELWKFDGTTPSRVADINPAGNANPAYLTAFNNELYFQANANDGAGAELWKFKGP